MLYYLLPPTCLLKNQTNKSKDENKQNKKLNNLTDTKTIRIQKISTISSPSSVAKYLTSKLNMFLFKKLSSILFKSFHILENNMNRQIKRNSYYYRYEAIRYLTLWFYSHKEIALVAVKILRLMGISLEYCFFLYKDYCSQCMSVINIEGIYYNNCPCYLGLVVEL